MSVVFVLARALVLGATVLACGGTAATAPAPPRASTIVVPTTEEILAAPLEAALIVAPAALLASMHARLPGQRAHLGDGVLLIDDIAGLGRPWVGVVQMRCDRPWLVTALGALRLTGPLARPRLAGPGYLVWALGQRRGPELAVARLGVLARPDELQAAGQPALPAPPCPEDLLGTPPAPDKAHPGA